LKYVVRSSAAVKKIPDLNAREMMSAMTFLSPPTWWGTTWDAPAAQRRIPRRRNSLPAVIFLDVRNLYAHATAEMLSQNVTIW